MHPFTVAEANKQRAELAQENLRRQQEWEAKRSALQRRVSEMGRRAASLKHERETLTEKAAEALIEDQPFDVSIFTELDGRIIQAERAWQVLQKRLKVFETYNKPALYLLGPEAKPFGA